MTTAQDDDKARATTRGGRFVGVVGADRVHTAGASVWWECGKGCTRAALEDAWDAAGLDPKVLPSDKSMEAALHDAVNTMAGPKVFVRRAPGGGWLLVAECDDKSGTDALSKVRWESAVHASLDRVGRLAVTFRDPAAVAANTATEQHLRAEYFKARTALTGDEVTRWIGALLTGLKGVLLRGRGGLWFVPGTALPAWHAMADVIAAVSGTVIEEMTTVCLGDDAGRTVSTIMGAVKRDALAAMADAMAALDAGVAKGKPLGPRARETQARNLRDAMDKVRSYEDVLGVEMTELRADLEAMRATVAAGDIATMAGAVQPPVRGLL